MVLWCLWRCHHRHHSLPYNSFLPPVETGRGIYSFTETLRLHELVLWKKNDSKNCDQQERVFLWVILIKKKGEWTHKKHIFQGFRGKEDCFSRFSSSILRWKGRSSPVTVSQQYQHSTGNRVSNKQCFQYRKLLISYREMWLIPGTVRSDIDSHAVVYYNQGRKQICWRDWLVDKVGRRISGHRGGTFVRRACKQSPVIK